MTSRKSLQRGAQRTLTLQVLIGYLQVRSYRMQSSLATVMIGTIRESIYARVLAMPLRQQMRFGSGDLLHRLLSGTESIRDLLIYGVLPVAQAAVLLAGMAVVMISVDPSLSAPALAVVPPMLLVTRRNLRRTEQQARAARAADGALYDVAQQTLSQRVMVTAFSQQAIRSFQTANLDALKRIASVLANQIGDAARSELVLACGTALVLVVGAQRVVSGDIGVGALVLFVSYLVMMYRPLNALSVGVDRIANAHAALDRVHELVNVAIPLREGTLELESERVRGHIKIEGVSFGYTKGRLVFDRLSLEILPGETVGIVGDSGAGKSTLLALLLRLDDPDGGRITLDGTDLRDFRMASLRSAFALVPHPPIAFRGTIRANLGSNVSDEELMDVCELTAFAPVLARLVAGLAEDIGERGQKLSEGERQRLALAHALVRRSPIVLLDEPTAALDATNEAQVIVGLRKALQGRTAILISHRLEPLCLADRIIVLSGDRIVEQGKFNELSARDSSAQPYQCLRTRSSDQE